MGVSKASEVKSSSRWVPWSTAGNFGGLQLCYATGFPGNFMLKWRNSSRIPFGKPVLVLLGIRIRKYGLMPWFVVTTKGLVSVGSILPYPRKRKNELEKEQDKPKELECAEKVPHPPLCFGVTLVIIPKKSVGFKPTWHELPFP